MMQSQKKHVIKIFSLVSLLFIILGCQKAKSDDIILLEKVISTEFNSNDSIEISANANFKTKLISNYYKIRFLDENPITIYGDYGEGKNKTTKAPKEEQEKFNNSIIKQFQHPDITLSQKDIESMIEQQKEIKDWTMQELNDLKIKLKDNSSSKSDVVSHSYMVSRPIYSLDKQQAIIHYSLPNKFSYLVFCKKDGNKWVFTKTLKKIF